MNLYMNQCKVTYPAEVDMISHEQYAILKLLSTADGYVNNFNNFFVYWGYIPNNGRYIAPQQELLHIYTRIRPYKIIV